MHKTQKGGGRVYGYVEGGECWACCLADLSGHAPFRRFGEWGARSFTDCLIEWKRAYSQSCLFDWNRAHAQREVCRFLVLLESRAATG